MADTWGISGSAFLAIYSGLLAMTTLAVWVRRRRWQAGLEARAGTPTLDTYDLAMLNGGEALALATAVANLWEAGVVTVEEGQLRVTQPLAQDAQPVEQAVYQALDSAQSTKLWSVQSSVTGHPALAAVQERLVRHGLLYPPSQISALRRLALWFLPVLVLGIARLFSDIANGRLVGSLLVLLALTAGLSLWATCRSSPQTPSGQRLLAHVRDIGTLNGLTLGGLDGTIFRFGLGELWNWDAEFADALGVPREAGSAEADGCGGDGCDGGCGDCAE